MKTHVYFADIRSHAQRTIFDKIDGLFERINLKDHIKPNGLIAIKMHLGEKGNTAFISPLFIKRIVDNVKLNKGKPFITDTCTLYRGDRSDAVTHLTLASRHGFSLTVVDAPVVIADGIRGNTDINVAINKPLFEQVCIGTELINADSIISVAHFKGHELTGFGGTLKNLGMGGASRKGKLAQHSNISPKVIKKLCIGCGNCCSICPSQAISLTNKKASIDQRKCIGCAECITICLQDAIQIRWNETTALFQKKMIEHVCGVLQGKEGRALYLNFLMNISPACDCYGHADAPIVPDIGILASTDPVAIDQAAVDLVNQEAGMQNTALQSNLKKGSDKFKGLYPEVNWEVQLDYAEQCGLGVRNYSLSQI